MELADEADKIAMRYFRRDLRIDRKPDRTFVTQADTAVEKALRERIGHRYPGHGVLAEEFGDRTAKQETRWIIDPIDATHSYLRGIPVFATLIALERAGVMELCIITAPAMRERWHAARGGGAWSGKRRLHVSRVAEIGDTLRDKTFPDICHTAQEAVDGVYGFYGTVRLLIGGLAADPPARTARTIEHDAAGNITGHIGTSIAGAGHVSLGPLFDRQHRLEEIETQRASLLKQVDALSQHPWGNSRT